MEDSFNPKLIIENRYPGTIRINIKNEMIPKIKTYLLSYIIPIGIIAKVNTLIILFKEVIISDSKN